jgi:hypothetical protein
MLKKIFDNLDIPDGEKEDSYVTEKIFKKNHRIGKNFKNQPSLLFKTKKNSGINNNYLGKNIYLRFDISCTITEGKKKVSENYTILSCISEDKEIKKIFLEVCETTFLNIDNEPTNGKVREITESIIDLFKNLPDAKKGFIGLWGELFLIVSSNNQVKVLEAWHNHAEDKYDFYDNNEVLEVKCTTQGDRKHDFRHHQLVSKIEGHYVASIKTKENYSKGLSVVDLYKKILKNKLDISLKDKLNKIYYKIVGKTPEEKLNEYKYDYDFAKRNVLYFKIQKITTLVNKDKSISDIKYTMDLSQKQSVDHLSKDKFTSYLYFPSA